MLLCVRGAWRTDRAAKRLVRCEVRCEMRDGAKDGTKKMVVGDERIGLSGRENAFDSLSQLPSDVSTKTEIEACFVPLRRTVARSIGRVES